MTNREALWDMFHKEPSEVNRLVLADYLESHPEGKHDLTISANLRKHMESVPIVIVSHWSSDYERGHEQMLGKTLVSVIEVEYGIKFSDGKSSWTMRHEQECCENVSIEVIHGDLQDLVGSPLLRAEELTTREAILEMNFRDYLDSFTHTYYFFETEKGKVCVKWYGESNGYYGETPSLYYNED